VAPPAKAIDLLCGLGLAADAFVNLKRKPKKYGGARPRKPSVRHCASCGRWLEKSKEWTIRLGTTLRAGDAKLTSRERARALWYCESGGCREQAIRLAAKHRSAAGHDAEN